MSRRLSCLPFTFGLFASPCKKHHDPTAMVRRGSAVYRGLRAVEETDPGLSSFSCLIRLRAQPAWGGREGCLLVPRFWESPGGHSRDLTFCDALLSLLSVARGGGHPRRGVLYDGPQPLLSVARDGVANSVARRNLIRTQASEPHCARLEHKTRQEFRPIRKR
jgi:hypothetical protein